jgi:hypothetical protein
VIDLGLSVTPVIVIEGQPALAGFDAAEIDAALERTRPSP